MLQANIFEICLQIGVNDQNFQWAAPPSDGGDLRETFCIVLFFNLRDIIHEVSHMEINI